MHKRRCTAADDEIGLKNPGCNKKEFGNPAEKNNNTLPRNGEACLYLKKMGSGIKLYRQNVSTHVGNRNGDDGRRVIK